MKKETSRADKKARARVCIVCVCRDYYLGRCSTIFFLFFFWCEQTNGGVFVCWLLSLFEAGEPTIFRFVSESKQAMGDLPGADIVDDDMKWGYHADMYDPYG